MNDIKRSSMKNMAILPVIVIFCALFSIGVQSKHVNTHGDLTVMIDFKKYQELRHTKLILSSNKTSAELCAAETEEYRKCGSKCVLSCKFASSSSEIAASKEDCEKTECIEGCFCKDGFVRYQGKCIPMKECPIRSNKAIEDGAEVEDSEEPEPLELDDSNSEEKRIKPNCGQGSDCSCEGNECISLFKPQRPTKPTKPSNSCTSPGCNTGSISIVNHNQLISHNSGGHGHGHSSSHSSPNPIHVHVQGQNQDNDCGPKGCESSGHPSPPSHFPFTCGQNGCHFRPCGPNGCNTKPPNCGPNGCSSKAYNNNNNNNVPNIIIGGDNGGGNGWTIGGSSIGGCGRPNCESYSGNSGNNNNNNNNGGGIVIIPGWNNQGGGNGWGGSGSGGFPFWRYNSTTGDFTAFYRTYSITYNRDGTATVNVYGMGSYDIVPNGPGNFPFRDEPTHLDSPTESPMSPMPEMQGNVDVMSNPQSQNGENVEMPGSANHFLPNQRPILNYQNLPPIIQEILEASVPPPPSPILAEQMNVWYNYPNKQPNTENGLNIVNEASTQNPSEQSNSSTEKPPQESETPANSIQPTPGTEQEPVTDKNGNAMANMPVLTRPVNSIFLHSTGPLLQAAYYTQYNAYVPYIPSGIFNNRFPFNQNVPSPSQNKPMNPENNSAKPPINDIIIKVGEF